jgi:hypothetical protein
MDPSYKKNTGKPSRTHEVKKTIILIDMDGVIADFELEILNRFKRRYPDKKHVPLEERTQSFYVQEEYNKRGLDGAAVKVQRKS